jgi:hypothetical protein
MIAAPITQPCQARDGTLPIQASSAACSPCASSPKGAPRRDVAQTEQRQQACAVRPLCDQAVEGVEQRQGGGQHHRGAHQDPCRGVQRGRHEHAARRIARHKAAAGPDAVQSPWSM